MSVAVRWVSLRPGKKLRPHLLQAMGSWHGHSSSWFPWTSDPRWTHREGSRRWWWSPPQEGVKLGEEINNPPLEDPSPWAAAQRQDHHRTCGSWGQNATWPPSSPPSHGWRRRCMRGWASGIQQRQRGGQRRWDTWGEVRPPGFPLPSQCARGLLSPGSVVCASWKWKVDGRDMNLNPGPFVRLISHDGIGRDEHAHLATS